MADPRLYHELVTPPAGAPDAWLYILPGIFGSGRNWATVARRLVAERPDWAVVLVDLRQHGGSQGFGPPHSLQTAAGDVHRLADVTERPMSAVLGHSFGGKVALELAPLEPPPADVWIIDSTPEAREPGGSAWSMLSVLRALPPAFGSRDEAVQAMQARGIEAATAQWMATNLERVDSAMRWRFELPAMEALLLDFFRTDAWPVVRNPPGQVRLHFVRASQSSVMSSDTAERIQRANARVTLHTLEGGHWLNADNPAAVVSLLARELPSHADARQGGARPQESQ